MFKDAKQIRKYQKNIFGANFIRDADSNIKVDSTDIGERWKRHFGNLLNERNLNNLEEVPAVQVPLEQISYSEVEMALRKAKNEKAAGLSEVSEEMFTSTVVVGLDMLGSV